MPRCTLMQLDVSDCDLKVMNDAIERHKTGQLQTQDRIATQSCANIQLGMLFPPPCSAKSIQVHRINDTYTHTHIDVCIGVMAKHGLAETYIATNDEFDA
jgi:hypothetical protein